MKILLTHERFAPDFAGGGEYVALETARGLRKAGDEVEVLTTGNPAVTDYEGIPTTRLRRHRYLFNLSVGRVLALARDVDLIQTFTYHACLASYAAGRRLGKPVVCTVLGLFGSEWRSMRGWAAGRAWETWERWLVRRPFDRVVFLSDFSRDLGLAMGVDPHRSAVISPGIDIQDYGPAQPKEDVVLFAGKLDDRKGVGETLEAARLLPEVRFRFFGWGPREAQWRGMAPSNVEFVPFERGEALRRQFARARIFVFPSRVETFGIALVEAMASGCAIVSSSPLLFRGLRTSSHQPSELADAIWRLWNDRGLCEQMGRENVELAQNHTWAKSIGRLKELYEDILSGGEGQGRA